jgi:4a-hydroxytetrahydrobiopterin dehydratase
MSALKDRRCVPCEGGTPALDEATVARMLAEVPGWELRREDDQPRLGRRFRFRDFVAAMAFINKMAALAEAEGHHPDFAVHYNRVDVTLWTHAVGGLSDNDFVLAAKIDTLIDGTAEVSP